MANEFLLLFLPTGLGILMAQVVLTAHVFHATARGYLVRAIGRTMPVILTVCVVEWAIAVLCASVLPDPNALRRFCEALVLAFCIGAGPSGLVNGVASVMTHTALRRTLVKKLVAFLKVVTVVQLRTAIQNLREDDNLAWQFRKSGWDFGVDQRVVQRRIRALYAKVKVILAEKHNDAELLCMDYNVHPGQLFYLLVDHLGRNQLHSLLRNPCDGWDGKENRRDRGLVRSTGEPYSRVYDNPIVRQRIAAVTLSGSLPAHFEIGWAGPEDAAAIQTLENKTWRGDAFEHYAALLALCPESVLIAKDGDLLGYVAVERLRQSDLGQGMPPWNHDPVTWHRPDGRVWYIVNHAVQKKARGAGISPMLIQRLIQEAENRDDVDQVVVIFNLRHPYLSSGQEFWGKHGFECIPESLDPNWSPVEGGTKTGAVLYARHIRRRS